MTTPPYIKQIRSDMSDWLIHCTTSMETLRKILNAGALEGSNTNIKGGHNCICFSEAPLTKIKSLTSFINRYGTLGFDIHYTQYGLAFKKEWLFQKGARPVIYQPDQDYYSLP